MPQSPRQPKRRPIDIEDLWSLQRVGGVALAPDGERAVCSVTSYSMDDNRGRTQLWLLGTRSGAPRPLTSCGEKDGQAAWSPRGERIAFVGKREQEGHKDDSPQLYLIDANGGEARRASRFAPGIESFKWMPDGRRVVFVAWVWPGLKGAAAQSRQYKRFAERKESGYVTSEAQYRDFDHNLPMGRVAHLLMLELASGRISDLFEGTSYELPRDALDHEPFDISADGRRIAFTHDPAPVKRSSHCRALVELDLARRRFTALTQAADWDFDAPRYSPDGRQLACIAARRGTHHMALGQLALVERGGRWRTLGDPWEHDVNAPLRWSSNGCALLFTAEQQGRCHLWRHDLGAASPCVAVPGGWVQGFDVAGDVILTAADSGAHPVRLHAHREGVARRLEHFNDRLLERLDLGRTELVELRGALGDKVQMRLVFPPGFDARRKHPVLHVIHGGPYAAAGDTWVYRWNDHLLASRGHVVAQVNYHGSSGFGFASRSAIVGRLGELELQDIEAGTEWLMRQRWVDRRRIFASGGSYGGFLVAWMNARAPAQRYRAYVCHAGVFDRVATMSADSFHDRPRDLDAWYWDDLPKVLRQSPHAYARHMNTPTLVIHGAQDFRVPDCNGLAYYNTLKARGVPARLLWFGDENHWVLKPRNSRQWYGEIFDWLATHDDKRPARRDDATCVQG